MAKVVVSARNVEHIYPDGTHIHIRGLPFTVHAGETVAILGPNGSGKTTLLNIILGLLELNSGNINVLGRKPAAGKFGKKLAAVAQNPELQLIGPTVSDDIAFALRNYGFDENETTVRVADIIQKLGIGHLSDRVPHYLSGGEKRKVAFAGAAVLKPELLVLDEITAELDPVSKEAVLQFIIDMSRRYGTAVILSTNDMDAAKKFETLYLIEHEKIIFKGTYKQLVKRKFAVCVHPDYKYKYRNIPLR